MSKLEQNVTMDKSNKNTLRNATYALLIALTIILSAVIIAVNANTSGISNNATVSVGTKPITYVAPMENASVVKDFSNKELQ